MKPDSHDIDLLLNEIEEKCPQVECQRLSVPFMLDCMPPIEDRMPAVAIAALVTSRLFAKKEVSASSVADATQRCWKELDAIKNMPLESPEVSGTRAVICILHKQLHPEDEDFLDLVSFFLKLVNNLEPHADNQAALLRKYFSQCLCDK